MSIEKQLRYGVRGLMLDIDVKKCSALEIMLSSCNCEGVCLCHGECSLNSGNSFKDGFSIKNLDYALKKIVNFLRKNKNEIITLFLEDYLHKTKQLQDVFDKVKGFNSLVFNPYDPTWNVTHKGWPKIADMIKANKRILIVDDEQRGAHATKRPGIIRSRDFLIQNHFEWKKSVYRWDVSEFMGNNTLKINELLLNGTILELDMADCFSWHQFKGKPVWNSTNPLVLNYKEHKEQLLNSEKLFLFNHFYGVAALAGFVDPATVKLMNTREFVLKRIQEKCDPGTNRKKPNYIALDFIDESTYKNLIEPLNM